MIKLSWLITALSLTLAGLSLNAADRALDQAKKASVLFREQATCEMDLLDSEHTIDLQIMARNGDPGLTGWEF